jgi:hypothetical protein
MSIKERVERLIRVMEPPPADVVWVYLGCATDKGQPGHILMTAGPEDMPDLPHDLCLIVGDDDRFPAEYHQAVRQAVLAAALPRQARAIRAARRLVVIPQGAVTPSPDDDEIAQEALLAAWQAGGGTALEWLEARPWTRACQVHCRRSGGPLPDLEEHRAIATELAEAALAARPSGSEAWNRLMHAWWPNGHIVDGQNLKYEEATR